MVKSGKKRFVRYQEGAELYSMGLHTFLNSSQRKQEQFTRFAVWCW